MWRVQEHERAQPRTVCGTCEKGSEGVSRAGLEMGSAGDPERLREVIRDLALGKFDVVLFTSSVQVHHLFEFACSSSRMKWGTRGDPLSHKQIPLAPPTALSGLGRARKEMIGQIQVCDADS